MQTPCKESDVKKLILITLPRIENLELSGKFPRAYVIQLCCDWYKENKIIREDIGLIDYIHYPNPNDALCFVTTLIITRPENRRKGYGRKLITEMLKNAHDLHCKRVTLRVSTVGEHAPSHFYEKLGFTKKEVDPVSHLALFEYLLTQPKQ